MLRALERFLVAFTAIALGMRIFHSPTAPVFLIIGFAALAIYYLLIFPFLRTASATQSIWQRILARVLTGLAFAYALSGLLLYTLGWIKRADVLGNSCVVLASLLGIHSIAYWLTKSAFSRHTILRAGIMLFCMLLIALALPQFNTVR